MLSSPYWDYFMDRYRLSTGAVKDYHYIRTADSVMIVPCLAGDRFVMVRQLRVPSQQFSLEFPGGGVRHGESAAAAAGRELREETGYETETLSQVGLLHPCNGLSSEVCTVFVAENLMPGTAHPEETEELEVVTLSQNEMALAFRSEDPLDSMTVAAWFLFSARQATVLAP